MNRETRKSDKHKDLVEVAKLFTSIAKYNTLLKTPAAAMVMKKPASSTVEALHDKDGAPQGIAQEPSDTVVMKKPGSSPSTL
eukprot:4011170-Karenia_brevis.AAC.1